MLNHELQNSPIVLELISLRRKNFHFPLLICIRTTMIAPRAQFPKRLLKSNLAIKCQAQHPNGIEPAK